MSILPQWLDPVYLLDTLGGTLFVVVCLIVFAECGLLVGFFLPGDSLLFITGLAVARGSISEPLWLAAVILTVCAFAGNMSGYWIGRAVGPKLFNKPDSKLFKQEYVDKTHAFFEKYGARAIILARFVPIVRTFITAIAGVGKMDQKKFFTYSAVGGALWAAGITVAGFYLGQIDFIAKNIELMLILVVAISLIPIVFEIIKARKEKKAEAATAAETTQVINRIQR
ncbi:VTT domain-containing protein [Actinocrispum sp. NPDC049592]|uniref:DedA family protein n=1 Tax=Actinocrispum sp. NPDC049592 TaxID=3154835 RepID=UPI003436E703